MNKYGFFRTESLSVFLGLLALKGSGPQETDVFSRDHRNDSEQRMFHRAFPNTQNSKSPGKVYDQEDKNKNAAINTKLEHYPRERRQAAAARGKGAESGKRY